MSIEQVKVSVLMTAFNRESFLSEAIESVLSQSYSQWELIIVDDLSEDSTFDIARGYAKEDPRIRVFRNDTNLGDYPNRNRAASVSKGEYLKYLDSDDVLYRHSLATCVEMMEEHPEACMGLSLGSRFPGHRCPVILSPEETIKFEFLGPGGLLSSGPCNAIFRRSTFESFNGFENHGAASDVHLWLRLWEYNPILILPADLHWPRTHGTQESTSPAGQAAYLQMCSRIWEFINQSPIFGDGERTLAQHNWIAAVRGWILRDIRCKRLRVAWIRFRQIPLWYWIKHRSGAKRSYRVPTHAKGS